MAIRNFATFCNVCQWTGYLGKDTGTTFPDEKAELCPNHGGVGLNTMTEERTNDLVLVRTRALQV